MASIEKTILVTDDERVVLETVCTALAAADYDVLRANDGEEALAVAADRNQPIDLLITDIAMGDVDGLDLAERLTAERPTLKVLYMSGYCDETALGARVRGKQSAFLGKPFTITQLMSKVNALLTD